MNKRTLKTLISTATDLVAEQVKKSKSKTKQTKIVKDKVAKAIDEQGMIKSEAILNIGEPQYIGEFPIRQEIEIMPLNDANRNFGAEEWETTQSLMITLFGIGGKITQSGAIKAGDWILTRSVHGGFYGPTKVIKRQRGGLGTWLFCDGKKMLVDVSYSKELGYWITKTKV